MLMLVVELCTGLWFCWSYADQLFWKWWVCIMGLMFWNWSCVCWWNGLMWLHKRLVLVILLIVFFFFYASLSYTWCVLEICPFCLIIKFGYKTKKNYELDGSRILVCVALWVHLLSINYFFLSFLFPLFCDAYEERTWSCICWNIYAATVAIMFELLLEWGNREYLSNARFVLE
jgi:hypothetical protein